MANVKRVTISEPEEEVLPKAVNSKPGGKWFEPTLDERDFSDPGGRERSRAFIFTFFPKKPEGNLRDPSPMSFKKIEKIAKAAEEVAAGEIDVSEDYAKFMQAVGDRLLTLEGYEGPKVTKHEIVCMFLGPELAPTTRSPHIQGYVRFTDPITSLAFRKRIAMTFDMNRVRIRFAGGTALENQNYIVGPYENAKGTKHKPANPYAYNYVQEGLDLGEVTQGKSAALKELAEKARTLQYTEKELMDMDILCYAQHYKALEKVMTTAAAPDPYSRRFELDLYPWQQSLMTHFAGDVMRRRIFWVYSESSDLGKTVFQEYLLARREVNAHNCGDKITWDNFVNIYPKIRVPQLLLFDLPRQFPLGREERNLLETLSNTIIARSGCKYEGRLIAVHAHILVCSNEPPPIDLLPKRFVVYQIEDNLAFGKHAGVYDFTKHATESQYSPF